jgi:XRE family aerobic/anaerobic benzoate catabolism transcriptional regulator
VLATGGGIVVSPETYALLKRRALTIWLRAQPEDHWNRVVQQGDRRPMADNPQAMAELRRLLAAREPLYAQARHRVDTSRLGVDQAVLAIEGLAAA